MVVKIGHAAVGEKFLSTDGKHTYEVLAYVPKGGTSALIPLEGKFHVASVVVKSRHRPGHSFIYHKDYIRQARLYRQMNS